MAAWIRLIADENADPTLKAALDFARTPHDTVDNVMRVHSLRPSTMNGHVSVSIPVAATPGPQIRISTAGTMVLSAIRRFCTCTPAAPTHPEKCRSMLLMQPSGLTACRCGRMAGSTRRGWRLAKPF